MLFLSFVLQEMLHAMSEVVSSSKICLFLVIKLSIHKNAVIITGG